MYMLIEMEEKTEGQKAVLLFLLWEKLRLKLPQFHFKTSPFNTPLCLKAQVERKRIRETKFPKYNTILLNAWPMRKCLWLYFF